jgi:hypothetical protein
MQVIFGLDPASDGADHLARFALAAFDGAYIAHQSNPQISIHDLLQHLPPALTAIRRELSR